MTDVSRRHRTDRLDIDSGDFIEGGDFLDMPIVPPSITPGPVETVRSENGLTADDREPDAVQDEEEMDSEGDVASLDDLIEAIEAARWLAGRYEINDVAVRRQRLPRVFENIRGMGSIPNWMADRLDAIEHIFADESAQPSHRWARIIAEDSLSQLLDDIRAANP